MDGKFLEFVFMRIQGGKPRQPIVALDLSVAAGNLPVMNIDIWLAWKIGGVLRRVSRKAGPGQSRLRTV
jgi:hypothetical protein